MIDLGSGLGQSMSLAGNQFIGTFDHPHFGYNSYWGQGRLIPHETAAAFNTFAYFLEGAKGIRQLKNLHNGMNGYLYCDRKGQNIFALWRTGKNSMRNSRTARKRMTSSATGS